MLIPSLALLFRLVLRGRFDEPVQAAALESPAPAGRHAPLGIAGAVCAGLGAPLMFFSGGGATLALGVVLLLAGLAAGGAYLVAHVTLTDPGSELTDVLSLRVLTGAGVRAHGQLRADALGPTALGPWAARPGLRRRR